MALTVQEVMNAELFSLRQSDTPSQALEYLLSLDITGAPILDDANKPIGVISMRDLLARQDGDSLRELMTIPAATIRASASLQEAARLVAETGYRRLIVVDEAERAIGMVSAVDLVRGLIGSPTPHPASFPHFDKQTGLSWTDTVAFSEKNLDSAPGTPGVLVLVHGGVAMPEQIVWVEPCHNVRERLRALMAGEDLPVELARWMVHRAHLRYRASEARNAKSRHRAVQALISQLGA